MLIKGTAIRSTLQALSGLHGIEVAARVRAALPADIRAEIEAAIPTKMQRVELSAALQATIREVVGNGDCAVNYGIGIEAARLDFGGIYRIFLRMADVETSLRRLAGAWRQYNSQGAVTWESLVPGRGRCSVAGTAGFNEPMWVAIAGRVAGLLRLAGASTSSASIVRWSDDGCTLDVQWSR